MRRVIILGSTGSIGVQALEVISGRSDLLPVGLSCGHQVKLLLEQSRSFGVTDLAIADPVAAAAVPADRSPKLRIRSGPAAAARLVREVEADLVLNAIVGFAGLEATLASLEQGRVLALANKESLVSGGTVVTGVASRTGAEIIPVDSEHSALFQLLRNEERSAVEAVILTASGGPFRGLSVDELARVTPEEALTHPTWSMGAKITIDSATLMNKGLEIIEAHHLFGLSYDAIEVVLHPQSRVHALMRLVDGSMLAHLGMPDMRIPIAYALSYPERPALAGARLELTEGGLLEFASPDTTTFRCLELAREAGLAGDEATCALNAANEVAVGAFLARKLPFLGIPEVIESVLDRLPGTKLTTYDDVVFVDAWARSEAHSLCRDRAG